MHARARSDAAAAAAAAHRQLRLDAVGRPALLVVELKRHAVERARRLHLARLHVLGALEVEEANAHALLLLGVVELRLEAALASIAAPGTARERAFQMRVRVALGSVRDRSPWQRAEWERNNGGQQGDHNG